MFQAEGWMVRHAHFLTRLYHHWGCMNAIVSSFVLFFSWFAFNCVQAYIWAKQSRVLPYNPWPNQWADGLCNWEEVFYKMSSFLPWVYPKDCLLWPLPFILYTNKCQNYNLECISRGLLMFWCLLLCSSVDLISPSVSQFRLVYGILLVITIFRTKEIIIFFFLKSYLSLIY